MQYSAKTMKLTNTQHKSIYSYNSCSLSENSNRLVTAAAQLCTVMLCMRLDTGYMLVPH